MQAFENRRSRSVVVRLTRGEPLVASLEAIARDHAISTAWVGGHGVLARATLSVRVPMRDEATARTVEGPLELVSLTGDVASHEGRLAFEGTVVVAMHTDHGIVTLGGRLLEAEVEGVTLHVQCLDELGLRRDAERVTGLLGFRAEGAPPAKAAPAMAPAPKPEVLGRRDVRTASVQPGVPASTSASTSATSAAPTAWAAVVQASMASDQARVTAATVAVVDPIADDGGGAKAEEWLPAVGDWVDHRQFGLCRVERSGADGELLIKLESGRRKEIRLDFLEVLAPRKDGARRIFPLRSRKA